MRLVRSFLMALRMYSAIPVPGVEWNGDNMAYALCFFPFVGVVTGALLYGWMELSALLGLGAALRAAFAVVIPIFVTGGIHMDGFLDTSDALMSHAPRERKLEILKDSHSGAGAVIGCGTYLVVSFGVWMELAGRPELPFAVYMIPALARALSALAVTYFKSARGNGLLAAFKSAARKRSAAAASVAWALAAVALAAWLSPVAGLAAAGACAVTFIVYRAVAYRLFGGTTGDLAGWFVTVAELAGTLAVAVCLAVGG